MKPFRGFTFEGDAAAVPAWLNRLVVELAQVFDSLKGVITNDRLVRVTFVGAATDVTVTHALGAPPRTWEVVDLDAAATVYRSPTANTKPTTTIILRASAACTAVLRFT